MKICKNCGNTYGVLEENCLGDGNFVCTKCCQSIVDRNSTIKLINLKKNICVVNLNEFKRLYDTPELATKFASEEQLLVSPFRRELAEHEFHFTKNQLWISYVKKRIETTVLVYDGTLDVTEVKSTVRTAVKNYVLPLESILECKSKIKILWYPVVLLLILFIFYRIDIWFVLLAALLMWWSYGREIVLKTKQGEVYRIPINSKVDDIEKLIFVVNGNKEIGLRSEIKTNQSGTSTFFCSKCGKEVNEEWTACPYCGGSLKDEADIQNVHIPVKKKKSKKGWIISGYVAVAVVGAAIWGIDDSETKAPQNNEQGVIEALHTFTTLYQGDEKYCFLDNEEEWVLTYTSENEFVAFENDTVIECFTDAFGEDCFSEGSASEFGFSYDLSEDEARIYFDVEIDDGNLSIINYNFDRQEFECMVDLKKWEVSDTFMDFVEEYGLVQSMESDIIHFKETLARHDLTINDLFEVRYKTLDEQFVPDTEQLVESTVSNDVQVSEDINSDEVDKDTQQNSEATTSEEIVADREGWKEAYLEYLLQAGNAEYSYSLDYIDEDNVPELVINYMYTAEGIHVCTFDGEKVVDTPVGEYLQYRLQENLFCVSGGSMDYYYDIVYKIVDGIPVETSRGEYGIFDYDNIMYDEEGYMIYEYLWNGTKVSEYEYYSLLEAFDYEAHSEEIYSAGNGYLYDVMEVLSHPLDITLIYPYLNASGYESLLNHYVLLFDGIQDDKIHFNIMYDEVLIGAVTATITGIDTAEYKSANGELTIQFDINNKELQIEGYVDTLDLTGNYYGRWG